MRAISLERMTGVKTQMSNRHKMCYGRAGIMLLRSLHRSCQWRCGGCSKPDGGSHLRNTCAHYLLLERTCNAYARQTSCHTANRSGARPITLNFWWLQSWETYQSGNLGSAFVLVSAASRTDQIVCNYKTDFSAQALLFCVPDDYTEYLATKLAFYVPFEKVIWCLNSRLLGDLKVEDKACCPNT